MRLVLVTVLDMRHVVMFSGGIGSWAAAKRVTEQHGPENVTLLFADVGGRHVSPHVGEDEDVYRFIDDAAAQMGAELVTLNQGMDIWDVFKKDRYLGNPRLANCSRFLKQRPAKQWLERNTTPQDAVVYVGINWTETHRLKAIEEAYDPWWACAPLCERPYLMKSDMLTWCRSEGLEPPATYAQGYPHANCGGGCVRAGVTQFKLLLETHPERYAYWEAREQELREYLDKDVTILRDHANATSVPLTLRAFRERIEDKAVEVDENDLGGCGCFVD
jgi:hypothetical protein